MTPGTSYLAATIGNSVALTVLLFFLPKSFRKSAIAAAYAVLELIALTALLLILIFILLWMGSFLPN
jgi:hypothetical protein